MFGTKNPLRFAAQIGFLMSAIVHNIFLSHACLASVGVSIPGSGFPSSCSDWEVTTAMRLWSFNRAFW